MDISEQAELWNKNVQNIEYFYLDSQAWTQQDDQM